MMDTKRCSRCKTVKAAESFYHSGAGLSAYCRACTSDYYRERNRIRRQQKGSKLHRRPSPYYCPRCQQHLTAEDFYVHKSGKDAGRRLSYCKPCSHDAANQWQRNHPQIVYERRKRRTMARKLAKLKPSAA